MTEDVPARGSAEHYYSEQKAECEALLRDVTAGSDLEVYVLRPCIVAGPKATALADSMPWRRLTAMLPAALRAAAGAVQGLLPLLPDTGVPCSWCTTTTSPRRSRWPLSVRVYQAPTTWRVTARSRSAMSRGDRHALGARAARGRCGGVGRVGPAADGAGRWRSGSTSGVHRS